MMWMNVRPMNETKSRNECVEMDGMNFQLDEIDPTMVKMKNTDGITFAAHWMG
jgi:hypothetical protein